MGFFDWFKVPNVEKKQEKSKRNKQQADNLTRVKEGVISGTLGNRKFVLIREDVVDLFLRGMKLSDSKESYIAAFVGGLVGRSQDACIQAVQRYSEGKVLVEYYRSGSQVIEGSDIWDAPSYLVLL